jgi:hypothetical protein
MLNALFISRDTIETKRVAQDFLCRAFKEQRVKSLPDDFENFTTTQFTIPDGNASGAGNPLVVQVGVAMLRSAGQNMERYLEMIADNIQKTGELEGPIHWICYSPMDVDCALKVKDFLTEKQRKDHPTEKKLIDPNCLLTQFNPIHSTTNFFFAAKPRLEGIFKKTPEQIAVSPEILESRPAPKGATAHRASPRSEITSQMLMFNADADRKMFRRASQTIHDNFVELVGFSLERAGLEEVKEDAPATSQVSSSSAPVLR